MPRRRKNGSDTRSQEAGKLPCLVGIGPELAHIDWLGRGRAGASASLSEAEGARVSGDGGIGEVARPLGAE